jgi:hypothetical protein
MKLSLKTGVEMMQIASNKSLQLMKRRSIVVSFSQKKTQQYQFSPCQIKQTNIFQVSQRL